MLFREFAFTLAAAVLVSGIVAITLSPVMSCFMVHPAGKEAWLTRLVNRIFDRIRIFYGWLLRGALEMRWAIAIATVIFALAAVPLYMFSGKELAPVEDQSNLALSMEAAPDATLESTTDWVQKLAKVMETVPEFESMWGLATSSGGFGGLVTVPFEERTRNTSEIQPELFGMVSQIEGIRVFPFTLPPLPSAGYSDVELIVKSDLSVEEMADSVNEILNRARQTGKFMFIESDLKLDLPLAYVDVNRERVADLGMDLAMIAQELGVLLGGAYVNRFNFFNRSYEVIPQLAETDRQSINALMDLKIRGPSGELVPVSSFASIDAGTAPRNLTRFQQQSAVRLTGSVIPGTTKLDALDTVEGIAREVLGPSAAVDYAGQSRQLRQEGSALVISLGFALVMIYLVLSAQFHSFRDPLIVLLGSVPLSLSGALILTFLGFTTMNIYSQVGLITLVGLVAKNGILIVEFANSLQAAGKDKWHAIHEASQTRLRPVLMTSAATVFGHFPLVLVAGPGAEARNSIGIVLVAGMAIGTLFTLFVVPALYMLIAAKHKQDELPDIDHPERVTDFPEPAPARREFTAISAGH